MRALARPTRMHRGFTLMEVLIAIALILALFGAMFGFLHDLLSTRSRVLELTAQHRAATLLIDRIEMDLLTCIVGDDGLGAGVEGDETSLTILSRGVLANITRQGPDDHRSTGDLQRSQYTFDSNAHEVTARREAAQSEADDDHTLDARLFRVRFRYHDGRDWNASFNSLQADRLPTAVEIAVWYQPGPDEQWSEEEADQFGPAGERLTYDMQGVFDEQAFATRIDRDEADGPVPDRVRIVLVPDAHDDEDGDEEAETGEIDVAALPMAEDRLT